MPSGEASTGIDRLLSYLKETRGFDSALYDRATLSQRIDRRREAIDVDSNDEYVDYLEVHPAEFAPLFNEILSGVTAFFRDPEIFDYLRTAVIPALLHAKSETEALRVWSAGCASGEECYSIAMLLAEALGAEEYRRRVKIYATDVDEEELALARQAEYDSRQIGEVPTQLQNKYFDHAGDRWAFKKAYRRSLFFGRHDLLDDAPISNVDLLVCRNTLMYFNHEAQTRIVSRFRAALRDGGYLVVGKAETLRNGTRGFEPVDPTGKVFRKTATNDENVAQNPRTEIDRLKGALEKAERELQALKGKGKR